MKNFALILLSITLIWACGDGICPPDEKVGNLTLTQNTKSFNPYNNDNQLVFENNLGDNLIFTAATSLETSLDQLCVKELCTEPKIKGNTTCEFYESETQRIVFSTAEQDAVIDFLLFSDIVQKNATEFYQSMRINISQGNFIGQASILTDSINTQNLDRDDLGILHYFQFIGDFKLNEQSFQDVFIYDGSVITLYYSKKSGLLGFKTPDAIWTLRI